MFEQIGNFFGGGNAEAEREERIRQKKAEHLKELEAQYNAINGSNNEKRWNSGDSPTGQQRGGQELGTLKENIDKLRQELGQQ